MYGAERDRSGMMRRVAEELEIPRALGSVPYKQQAVWAAWQKLVENSAPIAVSEQVECTQGSYFHWAGLGDINRSEADVQFGVMMGIFPSYQMCMLREGEVLAQSHSCWCPTCFDVATAGPGHGARLAPYAGYKVAGCTRAGSAFCEWSNKSFRAKTGSDASSPDLRAQTHRQALAAGLATMGGQWVLVEAYGDEEGELWQPKAFAFGGFIARLPPVL
jgi:hypothetical protein